MAVEAGKDIVGAILTAGRKIGGLKDPGAAAGVSAVLIPSASAPVDLDEISPQGGGGGGDGGAVYRVGRIMAIRAKRDIIRRICPARYGIG